MSLTSFVREPEVARKFEVLHEALPPEARSPLPVAVRVRPRTRHFIRAGMAFDYLLRFELQRRAPHAQVRMWVAEYAPPLVHAFFLRAGQPERAAAAARNLLQVVSEAREALESYIRMPSPGRRDKAQMAYHALRLADLDHVYREGVFDTTPPPVDPADVEDLVALLETVPFEHLAHEQVLLLNPTFGEASDLVGGADADLIAGDTLIDIKVVREGVVKERYLNQLLGYFLLARRAHNTEPDFPPVRRVGLYFARHGILRVIDAEAWTRHPEFAAVERWFFDRARWAAGDPRDLLTALWPSLRREFFQLFVPRDRLIRLCQLLDEYDRMHRRRVVTTPQLGQERGLLQTGQVAAILGASPTWVRQHFPVAQTRYLPQGRAVHFYDPGQVVAQLAGDESLFHRALALWRRKANGLRRDIELLDGFVPEPGRPAWYDQVLQARASASTTGALCGNGFHGNTTP